MGEMLGSAKKENCFFIECRVLSPPSVFTRPVIYSTYYQPFLVHNVCILPNLCLTSMYFSVTKTIDQNGQMYYYHKTSDALY